jgi:hypothetical protein
MCFPSILSSLSIKPFHLYYRQQPHNRLPNDTFIPLLQRKLCLPIIPPSLHLQLCPLCHHANLDPHGDHLFSCRSTSKKSLHNSIRNNLYYICKKILPMANIIHSPHSVSLETPIEGSTKQPADVGFTPKPSSFKKPPPQPISLVAIDVTITRSPTPPTPTPTAARATSPTPARLASSETTLEMAHQDAETSKLYCHQYSSPGITCLSSTSPILFGQKHC